jgi:hypothetical protein
MLKTISLDMSVKKLTNPKANKFLTDDLPQFFPSSLSTTQQPSTKPS